VKAVRLRNARPEDAEEIALLLGQLGYPATAEQARARLLRVDALVAEEDERILGLAATHLRHNLQRDAPTCRLTALVVDEPARGQGIARALLDAVIADAERQGCERVEVTLRPERKEAEALYRSLGFEDRPLRLVRQLRRDDELEPPPAVPA
jgi:GNAT superfamily N-acetyltransferase